MRAYRLTAKGNTPLHEAVQSSRAPAAIRLLFEQGFRLEQRNNEGHMAIQHAALGETMPAVKMLLGRDPGAIAWRDKYGRGLLALARQTENEVEESLQTQYGEGGLGIRVYPLHGTVWRRERNIVTPSVVIRIFLELLLDYSLSPNRRYRVELQPSDIKHRVNESPDIKVRPIPYLVSAHGDHLKLEMLGAKHSAHIIKDARLGYAIQRFSDRLCNRETGEGCLKSDVESTQALMSNW